MGIRRKGEYPHILRLSEKELNAVILLKRVGLYLLSNERGCFAYTFETSYESDLECMHIMTINEHDDPL